MNATLQTYHKPAFLQEGANYLVLSIGLASITLHADGRIELMGTRFTQQLGGDVVISAERLDIITDKSCKISP